MEISHKGLSVSSVAFAIALLSFSLTAQAGKIISVPSASGAEGFGGWNLDNVDVVVKDQSEAVIPNGFDPTDGSYSPDYFAFDSNIYDDDFPGSTNLMGVLHGKDWPVGEPAGIKIVNDDTKVKAPKPQNCIVTTSYVDPNFLDTANPEQTICSSGFQTHKRFKVNMLANSLGAAVDLVFNVEVDGTSRDYQMFQKMNNYTGKRLEGFIVEVGTGVGSGFVKASDTIGLLSELSLSAPLKTGLDPETGIWDPEDLATFSHGLFGAIDKNFPDPGFFDTRPAGFYVTSATVAGVSDTFASTVPMPSNYKQAPPAGPPEQFGPWQYSDIVPTGIFFDDDADPATDAALMAFWGETVDGSGNYAWMRGNIHGWAEVDAATLVDWGSNPLYSSGEIEDLLNLGLNYIVTIGTVDATWPTWNGTSAATFTIRLIPIQDTSGIGDPGYITNPPPPLGTNARYNPLSPCRVFDTRATGSMIAAGTSKSFYVWEHTAGVIQSQGGAGDCGVPATAKAVVINLTSTEGAANGHLRIYPYDAPLTSASIINFNSGVTMANATEAQICQPACLFDISIYSSVASHVIGDVMGWFE